MSVQSQIVLASSPLAPVSRWRVHMGAHKTATTHMQDVLARLRPQLAARGVDFIPRPTARGELGLATRLRNSWYASRVPMVGRTLTRRMMVSTLDTVRLGPKTVLLSEENFIGSPDQLASRPFYPRASQLASRIATLGEKAELTVFLSIRSYETLLPSVYAEMIKHAPAPKGGFETVRARVLARPPRWSDLVARLQAAMPGIQLRVWRQEDYSANAATILSEFCDCPIGPLPKIAMPAWTRAPSMEGIRAAEALPADIPPAERRARVVDIYVAQGPETGGGPFRPLDAQDRTSLAAAYTADLEAMERNHPGVLMRFG